MTWRSFYATITRSSVPGGMKKVFLAILLIITAFTAGMLYAGVNYCLAAFSHTNEGNPQRIVVSQGETVKDISSKLQTAGIIRNAELFRRYLVFLAVDHKLHAGYFDFDGKEDLNATVHKMLHGHTENISVTIPPGLTYDKVAEILDANNICDAEAFKAVVTESSFLFSLDFLGERATSPEGILFPETYYFEPSTPPEVVAARMKNLTERYVNRLKAEFPDHSLSLYQSCILASIVEKEGAVVGEFPKIASVFLNRLKKKQKLESCATVLYALGYHKNALSYQDLKTESPFNTYLHEGLPPAPISNFSFDALKAVFNPANTDYYYFVADGDGTHRFSKSIAEHNRNKQIYKKTLQK